MTFDKSGDYNYMFGEQKPQESSPDDLNSLARFVVGQTSFPNIWEEVTEKSLLIEKSANLAPQTTPGLPAGFTYFGQFLDHDISFDSRGDREVHSHLPFELSKDQSVNQHSPVFNLEVIYGSNPVTDDDRIAEDVRPFLDNGLLPLMKIGRNRVSVTETRELPFDLLRHPDSPTAIIADPRSDGNLLLAQMHLLFLKLHNAAVIKLRGVYKSRDELFVRARRVTIRTYQHLIRNHYLEAISDQEILKEIRASGNRIFCPKDRSSAFIPFEFSAAVFRFGHSMIRSEYTLNPFKAGKARIADVQKQTGKAEFGATHSKKLSLEWAVDWRLFFRDKNGRSVNSAKKIDTQLVGDLSPLLPWHAFKDPRSFSIAALDLFRGKEKRLASGQVLANVAKKSYPSVEGLDHQLIESVFTDDRVNDDSESFKPLREMFRTETPLWFYILAEAETKGERVDKEFHRLGPLGSVVVCETIIGLLQISPFSILAEPLGESEDDQTVFGTASVGFGEVLELIQNVNADFQKTLYPEINYSFDDLYPEREKTTK